MQFSVLWISRCWANAWLIIKRTLVKSSRMQVNAWSCEKNTFLTFADWRRLIPFTIIAFNRTGANSFIARITVKVYRFSMTEDISNYFAIHRYGGPSTWCYGVKHVRITNFSSLPFILMGIIVFLLVTIWQWAIKTFSKNWTRTVIFIGQRRFNHWENCVLYITNFYFSLLPRIKALKLFMPTANIKLYRTSWFFVTLLKLSLIEKVYECILLFLHKGLQSVC